MFESRPEISVVLGTYNRLMLLQRCIESVRLNGITVPYEVIVIDGGSTDGSIQWLVAQADIITIVQHNKIKVEGRRRNRHSWGYFMNIAFNAAHAECICMISDDSYVYPGTVMAGYETWRRSHADIGAVAFRFRDIVSDEKISEQASKRFFYKAKQELGVRTTMHGVLYVNHGMFSKSLFQRLGGFDEESYGFFKADCDFGQRMVRAGYKTIVAEETQIDHYMMEDEIRSLVIENEHFDRDRRTYRARWSGAPPPLPFFQRWTDRIRRSARVLYRALSYAFGRAGRSRRDNTVS